jgi:hypothetical protein
MAKFNKGDDVFYHASPNNTNPIRARVRASYKAQSLLNITAMFYVDADGNDIAGTFIGDNFNYMPVDLFSTFADLPKKIVNF